MSIQLNLNNFHDQPTEVQEAIAFYTGSMLSPLTFTAEQRNKHYGVLESNGFLEKVGAFYECSTTQN